MDKKIPKPSPSPTIQGTWSKAILPTKSVDTESTPQPLTFRADLLRPVPSQLELAYDKVTQVIEQLDERARQYGTTLGVSMTNFELNPFELPSSMTHASSGLQILYGLTSHSGEFIALEKRDGRWGLWYTKTPPVLSSNGRTTTTVPLRDAPLEARMKFLNKSEAFFREYMKRAEEGLGSPQQAISAGQRTLEMLNNIKHT